MHDAEGRQLQVGDKIIIEMVITELHPTEEYCNISAKSILGRRPDGAQESFSAFNTAVAKRANLGDENEI